MSLKIRPLFHWTENPLLAFLVFAVAGKVMVDSTNFPSAWLIPAGFLLIGLSFAATLSSLAVKFRGQIDAIRRLLFYSLFFFIGATLACCHFEPQNIPKHQAFVALIQEEYGPTATGKIRCLARLEAIKSINGWQKESGKVILFLDGVSGAFPNGTRLVIAQPLVQIERPTIPGQFDAKAYFARQGIHYQNFVPSFTYQFISPSNPDFFRSKALIFRGWLENQFLRYLPDKNDSYLLSGLLLGLRRNLDPELKVAFSAAGISHILAVSGMHVALIFVFLQVVFGRLKSLKNGNLLFSVFVLSSLWFYALLTGLSPSVLRAVTIFSLFQLGDLLKKPSWPINSLCLATLVLMAFDSNIVYDVGYQLSFAAVYGIVSFQRPFQELVQPQNIILKYFWNGTSVTIAATLATFPLILYYFHQFPVYFLVANLVAVPISNGLIYAGIGLLLVSPFPPVAHFVGWAIHWIVSLFIALVQGISHLPHATLQSIFFPVWFLVFLFLGLIFLQVWLKVEHAPYLKMSLVALCCFLVSFLGYNLFLWNRPATTYIMRTGDEWMLAFVKGRSAHISRLGSGEIKTDRSFESKALKEGLHVLDVQSSANAGLPISIHSKDSTRKSVLVWQSGRTFLFLRNFMDLAENPVSEIPIDFLIVQSVGEKTIHNALLQFHPKEIWVDWSEKQMEKWRNMDFAKRIPIRNFRKSRFVALN